MCVVVAKYFQDKGWILAKNRDQNYVATLRFLDKSDPEVGEIFVMDDLKIKYKEGMNYHGLTIITTSLTPVIKIEDNSSDGANIYKALHLTDPMEAAKYLVSKEMTGYIFCATPDTLVLVEAARKDKNGEQGVGKYEYTIRTVPHDEFVVRTNHGVDLPWAGFQPGYDKTQDMWYESSITRMEIAERLTRDAKNPVEMLDGLAARDHEDLQLNVFRIEEKPGQMRTIFQWAFVPGEAIVYLRPIETKMDVNVSREMIQVKVVDNSNIKKAYNGEIRHFTKLKVSPETDEVKSVTEGTLMPFKKFISM